MVACGGEGLDAGAGGLGLGLETGAGGLGLGDCTIKRMVYTFLETMAPET